MTLFAKFGLAFEPEREIAAWTLCSLIPDVDITGCASFALFEYVLFSDRYLSQIPLQVMSDDLILIGIHSLGIVLNFLEHNMKRHHRNHCNTGWKLDAQILFTCTKIKTRLSFPDVISMS